MTHYYPAEWIDGLLADIAERIQLSPSDYDKAVDRYQAIAEWLCRDSSSLAKSDPLIYPQGSFRTQSTIVTGDEDDRYDIDLVLEMKIAASNPPDTVLDALFAALNGEPGGRYYGKVEKKKRCVNRQLQRHAPGRHASGPAV